ncbi:ABC transporter permease [Thermococcus thioreducens]|uniref:ABC transporter n=1 Tax=Thermococcus thioreducens TaxID=277988 RepID=A0A0Q2M151_9EURY|nr:ABC transporter permease [Thermococcus thioreducens]ASJ13076.1 ABC transporter [Thermococcus thioreducens]KQH81586.1 ABC transporter [Thermococcus thioreducens]SEV81504.1 ABC-2 type transport system permease protein [Thermococcus thioreducens]
MSDFWVMAKKELWNLFRDKKLVFGLVVVPLILLPVMGKAVNIGMEQAQGETQVTIVNFDEGAYGNLLIKALNVAPNVTVTVVNATTLDEAIQQATQEKQNVLVVIPPDFTAKLQANETATVGIYGIFTTIGTGIKESVSEGRINAVLGILSDEIARIKVKNLGASNPDAILQPIRTESRSVINNRVVDISPTAVSSVIAAQAFTIPLIVFMMVMITSQMAAGAIASEKENKTLETLLTLPVARTKIVTAKIFGTAMMGLVAAVAYMVGMRYYMSSFGLGSGGVSLEDLGLVVTPTGALMFALVVFLTIIIALSLAMIVATFAEDVQSATTLVSAVILPLAFPAFLLMYTDINDLPALVRYVLLAIPFTHPVIDYRHVLLSNYTPLIISTAYLAVLALLVLYTTAWLFSTERILTAGVSWGKKKKKTG